MRRLWPVLAVFASFLLVTSRGIADDQAIAKQIVNVIQRVGILKYDDDDVSVRYAEGTAYLRGTVRSQQQMTTAIEIAQASPYVERVVNEIQITSIPSRGNGIRTSRQSPQYADSGPPAAVTTLSQQDGAADPQVEPASSNSFDQQARDVIDSPRSQQVAVSARSPVSTRQGGMPVAIAASTLGAGASGPPNRLAQVAGGGAGRMGPGAMPQPSYVPGTGGGVARAAYDQPNMPGYAWPSYAAYPNYAALTYPKQYSPTAWPYIGPFYPYPQVPLGWRKVTLQWQDGWWFLDFKD